MTYIIAIVEDDEAVARAMTNILQIVIGDYVRIRTYTRVDDLPPDPPDAVLLDLNLEDTRGMETVERFNGYPAPVVIFTAVDDPRLLETLRSRGHRVIEKPRAMQAAEAMQAVLAGEVFAAAVLCREYGISDVR